MNNLEMMSDDERGKRLNRYGGARMKYYNTVKIELESRTRRNETTTSNRNARGWKSDGKHETTSIIKRKDSGQVRYGTQGRSYDPKNWTELKPADWTRTKINLTSCGIKAPPLDEPTRSGTRDVCTGLPIRGIPLTISAAGPHLHPLRLHINVTRSDTRVTTRPFHR